MIPHPADRPALLSDAEIVKLSLDLVSVLGGQEFVSTVRAIEAAVLAKLNGAQGTCMRCDAPIVCKFSGEKYVTEQDARARERRAWATAVDFERETETRITWPKEKRLAQSLEQRDHLYPSLATLDPPNIRGVTGRWYRWTHERLEWRERQDCAWVRCNMVDFADVEGVAAFLAQVRPSPLGAPANG